MLEFKKLESQFSNLVTWAIFVITLIFVIIALISAVFPNLLLITLGGSENYFNINPTELGFFAYPLLITNIIIFGLAILYLKNELPSKVKSSIQFIFNFEVSPKITFLVITILVGFYILFSVGELFDGKFQADYNERVRHWINNYNYTKIDSGDFNSAGVGGYLHVGLGYVSLKIFDNVKVIPFLTSISLLLLTYFITYEITKKRFSGIVAFVILLQSGIFLHYDTGITYPNFWILFYLLSLYLIYKTWQISPLPYFASIPTKLLTIGFFPMTLLFIYRASISKQTKIRLVILYGIIIVVGFLLLNIFSPQTFNLVNEFDLHDFWGGFNAIHSSLRFDPLVVLFILPLIVGLFFKSKSGFREPESIIFFNIGSSIFSTFNSCSRTGNKCSIQTYSINCVFRNGSWCVAFKKKF